MKKDNDDIKKLFRSFGAEAQGFQELARAADASEAEARWPLLSSVQPGKRELPPLLSREEKSRSWQAPEPAAPRASKPAPASAGLGDKLSSSLQRQLDSKRTIPQMAQPATQAVSEARSPVSSQSRPAAAPVNARPKSLFSFAAEQPAKATEAPADALSSVFQRIGQAAEEKPTPIVRKGLLGRLGRS